MSEPYHFLIVEDSEADFLLLQRHLKTHGLQARCRRVDNLDELRDALSTESWDAVLCDYHVPQIDFLDGLKLIQGCLPEVPVILVSGAVGERKAVELVELGLWGFVLKENLERLPLVIERSLREAEDRRARRVAEEALQASELRYRRLFESAHDGILILDAETGRIEDVNPFLVTLLGFTKEQVLQKNVWELDGFHDLIPNQEKFAELQRNEYVRYEGLPLVTSDGLRIEVEFVSNLYQADNTKVIQCNVRDITERAVAEAKIHRLTRFYAALSQCNQAIVRCASEGELFPKICRIAVEFGGVKMAWIGLVDEATKRVNPAAAYGEGTDEYLTGIEISTEASEPIGHGPTGSAIRDDQPVWCQDFQHSPTTAPWRERGARLGWVASAGLPLHRDGVVIGSLTLYAGEPFDEDVRNLLVEMAEDISHALEGFARAAERKRAEEALSQSVQNSLHRAAALIELTREETGSRGDLPASLRRITERVSKTLDIARVSVWCYSPECDAIRCAELFELHTGQHSSGIELTARDYPAYFAALTGSEIIDADDAHTDARTCEFAESYLRPLGISSMLDATIRVHGKASGVVCHEHVGPARHWTADEKSFAVAIANLVSQVFEAGARAKVEAQLRLQGTALDSAANEVVITDRSGIIQWVNPAFTKTTGYTLAETVGQNPRVLKSGQHDQAFYQNLWDTILRGEVWHGELINRRKDGNLFTEEATITPVKDERGEITHFIAIKQDVTERKRAEEALRGSEEQMRAITDSAQDAIVMMNPAGQVSYWNPAAERIFGYTSAEAIGQHLHEFIASARYLEAYRAAFPIFQQTGQGAAVGKLLDLEARRKDGKELAVQLSLSAIHMDDGWHAVGILRDMTEHKKLEAQFLRAQRMESIGTLASGVAHDLNNILSPIMMSVPLLRRDLTAEQRDGIVATIEKCAERGAGIVKQVLTFGRGLSGEKHPLQVGTLIKELIKMMKETFPKNIAIESSLERDLWPVIGDATQLHQVLLNLCVNARDAMPEGGKLRLRAANLELDASYVSMRPEATPGRHVLLEVSDTGSGIPPEIIERIFDPFFTTKSMGQGTGLGLSTVHGIVKSHGGFIHVDTEPGKGSTFQVYLPASPDQQAAPADAGHAQVPEGHGELVLVVDDEESVRNAVRTVLEAKHYRVLLAADGAEALAAVAKEAGSVALVITDLMMPFMDGVALIRTLRKMTQGLPIIASTGLGERAPLAQLKAMGVETVLNKPYGATSLLRTIHDALHPAAHTHHDS